MIVEKYTRLKKYGFPTIAIEDQTNGDFVSPKGMQAPLGKPFGGWISIAGPDDWPSWCVSEKFRMSSLKYKHVFDLDTTHIKLISTEQEMDAFHNEWKFANQLGNKYVHYNIRWQDLAKHYNGIVISPYIASRRMRWLDDNPIIDEISDWYYGWDCASGCIWNPDCLTHLNTVLYDYKTE